MMPLKKTIAASSLGYLLLLPMPGQASVSLLSVSDSLSATVESISGSVQNSSRAIANVAEGDYKVVAIAQAARQPGKTQLTLVPVTNKDTEPFNLLVTQADFKQSGVQTGQLVHAQQRPYGMTFAKADSKQPFALLLDPAWKNEIKPQLVS